jgi:hypothetical protein
MAERKISKCLSCGRKITTSFDSDLCPSCARTEMENFLRHLEERYLSTAPSTYYRCENCNKLVRKGEKCFRDRDDFRMIYTCWNCFVKQSLKEEIDLQRRMLAEGKREFLTIW